MKKVLVADDEELIRLSIFRYLTSSGYAVDTVENGKDLVRLLERNTFDIVVTDFNMPEMNAIEVLAKIKEMGKTLPVIVTSADFSEKTIEESLSKGAFKCINKPFHMSDMLNVVNEATATSANISDSLNLQSLL